MSAMVGYTCGMTTKTNTTTDTLHIGDFTIYQLRADDPTSHVVWDHENGAHLPNAKGETEFTARDARDLALEYQHDAPATRPTYLAS